MPPSGRWRQDPDEAKWGISIQSGMRGWSRLSQAVALEREGSHYSCREARLERT